MSIDGENILYSWYCNSDYESKSEKDFSELETAAKNGDDTAIDHLYGVKAELGIDVEQNIAALEERCKNGSRQAARNLGILYSEGVAENGKALETAVIIPQDFRKSAKYLSMAAEQKDLLALYALCMQSWLRCHLASDDEDYSELYPDTSSQDFLDAENWLLKFYTLKDDASLLEDEKEFVHEHLSIVASWLYWLYKSEYHKSPIHSEEKAAEWNAKAKDFDKEEA